MFAGGTGRSEPSTVLVVELPAFPVTLVTV